MVTVRGVDYEFNQMQKTILIIEDDKYIREPLKELLESEGYFVLCAENGEEGLNVLHKNDGEKPNLILLDLMMPVKDGFQFREEQLASSLIAHLPVVVMSADGNLNAKSKKLTAQAYLKKPIDIDEVVKVVKQYCL